MEDDELTNSVQRGLRAGIPERGRFLTGAEHLVGHFQKLIASAVMGDAGALKAVAGSRDRGGWRSTVPVEPTGSAAAGAGAQQLHRAGGIQGRAGERDHHLVLPAPRRRQAALSLGARPVPADPGDDPRAGPPAMRTYTLSTASNPDHYRLSIRRVEGDALVSQFLHANAKPGFRIEAMAPRGQVRRSTESSDRPVVLISGGVGITPMMAMAEHIVAEGKRTGRFRPVLFHPRRAEQQGPRFRAADRRTGRRASRASRCIQLQPAGRAATCWAGAMIAQGRRRHRHDQDGSCRSATTSSTCAARRAS